MNHMLNQSMGVPKLGYALGWLVAGLLVAAHYHFHHRVEWDWALWWGIKDGLLWGALATMIWLASARFGSNLTLMQIAGAVVLLSILAALAHSLLAVVLSYLVEGYTTDMPFVTVVGHQLVKKAPLNLFLFLGITTTLFLLRRSRLNQQTAAPVPGHFLVHLGDGARAFLRPDEIEHVEAEGNYVSIHANGRRFLERQTMAETERALTGSPVVRVHRSHFVNLDDVERVKTTPGGSYEVYLASGKCVPMSRSYHRKLKNRLAQS